MQPIAKPLLSLAIALAAAATAAGPRPAALPVAFSSSAAGTSGIELHGVRLLLNGEGIRYRGPFRVYTARLYTPRKADTPEAVLAPSGPQRLAVTMLRDIDAGELGKLFVRSVEDNLDRATFSRIVPGLIRMSQIFSDNKRLAAGDGFTIDWIPGTGTVISVRGVQQGAPFPEPEFYAALMRIWLGPVPADWRLKEHLLGRAA